MKKYLIYIIILGTLLPISSYAAGISGYHIDKNINLIPNDPKGNKKVILITIDDGPSKYGRDMVATLERHKAKAIFFINGIHDKNNLGNIAFQANAGFAIGNHTWSHINLKKEKNLEKINKEINDDSKLIKTLTGASPKFFRPPYGMSTQYVRDMVKKEGMISMNWSGAALDWEEKAQGKQTFIDNVTTTIHAGEILLIHEHKWTAMYLDDLLKILEVQGYTFLDPREITQ